jgi:uncharacterized protein
MFLLTGDAKYYDIIERTLYNGLISGISLGGEEFFYPNPLEADGKYDFNQGHCTRAPWFDCSCCPTNLIRFIPSVSNLIYATEGENFYINLFISNEAKVSLKGKMVKLIQQTNYPWNGNIAISVNPEKKSSFTIKLRIPRWAKNEVAPGGLYAYLSSAQKPISVTVKGEKAGTITADGYLTITRNWNAGDKIEVEFPMEVKRVVTSDKVPSNKGLVALEYGPVVYCAEEMDNTTDVFQLKIADNEAIMVEYKPDLLTGVNVLKSEDEKPFTMIPYYAWSNRGIGKMKVWMSRL